MGFKVRYVEGTCPHCRGPIKATPNAGWNYVCCQCGRVWIIIDKVYWLAGFDAAGEIWEIKYEEMERINDYDPLWKQLWDIYRKGKK
jgi:hypothetical protein